MCSWGIFWTKIQRFQNTLLPFSRVWSKSRVLRMPPAHVTMTPGDTPPLTPLRNKLAPLTCRVDLIFPCYSRGLSKALPGFLVWPLISYYRLRIPWALMGYALKLCQTFVIFLRARGFATETCYPGHGWNGLALWNVTLAAVWWRESERRSQRGWGRPVRGRSVVGGQMGLVEAQAGT